MKKSFEAPEVIAAILTVAGTFLVSVILAFLEGRVGLQTLIVLFAILALGVLLFTLYKRTGPRVTGYAAGTMLLIGFAAFLGYRGVNRMVQANRATQTAAAVVGSSTEPVVAAVGSQPTGVVTPVALLTPSDPAAVTESTEAARSSDPTQEGEPVLPPSSAATSPLRGQWGELLDLPRAINDFASMPGSTFALFAAAEGGVYQSIDKGLTWSPTSGRLPGEPTALAASGETFRLYTLVGHENALYTSDDRAESWSLAGDMLVLGGFKKHLIISPDLNSALAVLDSQGLYISYDGGIVWTPPGDGLPGDERVTFVQSAVYDPSNPQIIYAGTGAFVGNGQGVFKSMDGGQTWIPSNKGMLDYRITALAVDPVNSQIVYAGGERGELWKSENGGEIWTDLSNSLEKAAPQFLNAVREIAVDPQDPGSVYLLADQAGLFHSSDGASTWRFLGGPIGVDQPFFESSLITFAPEPLVLVSMQDLQPWIWTAQP